MNYFRPSLGILKVERHVPCVPTAHVAEGTTRAGILKVIQYFNVVYVFLLGSWEGVSNKFCTYCTNASKICWLMNADEPKLAR